MLALSIVIGDGISYNHGVLTIVLSLSFIIYLLVAAVVGIIAEFIVGWRLPLGIIGAIIAALIGIWLITNVIHLSIPGDPVVQGIPIFRALLGAIILVLIWHLITYRAWSHRRRYYRRY